MAKSFDALVKRTTTKATRDRAAARTKELLGELLVGELRQAAGKSQRELAKMLGIKQPSLSKLENQSDIQVSTLQKIVEALGGELDLVARFPKGDVRIRQFGRKRKPKASRGGAARAARAAGSAVVLTRLCLCGGGGVGFGGGVGEVGARRGWGSNQ